MTRLNERETNKTKISRRRNVHNTQLHPMYGMEEKNREPSQIICTTNTSGTFALSGTAHDQDHFYIK